MNVNPVLPPSPIPTVEIDNSRAQGLAGDIQRYILHEKEAVRSLLVGNQALKRKLEDSEAFYSTAVRKILVLEEKMEDLQKFVRIQIEKQWKELPGNLGEACGNNKESKGDSYGKVGQAAEQATKSEGMIFMGADGEDGNSHGLRVNIVDMKMAVDKFGRLVRKAASDMNHTEIENVEGTGHENSEANIEAEV
ncbi:hypothetical protein RUND412_002719 [Rhizina undulata]